MSQAYSNPKRENDPHTPRAFFAEEGEERKGRIIEDSGWYYLFCSQMVGPFATESEALADAREGVCDDET